MAQHVRNRLRFAFELEPALGDKLLEAVRRADQPLSWYLRRLIKERLASEPSGSALWSALRSQRWRDRVSVGEFLQKPS